MGWAVGRDPSGRDIGYGVPATCDHPGCGKRIDRGLSYVCGGEPWGGEHGCGLFFCHHHRSIQTRGDNGEDAPQLCDRCAAGEPPFEPTPDVPEWIEHKLTDESWGLWREENPEAVAALTPSLTPPGGQS